MSGRAGKPRCWFNRRWPVAEDGIDEYLASIGYLSSVEGVNIIVLDGPSLALVATGTGATWWIDDSLSARRSDRPDGAASVVSAPAERLFLFVWGRVELERCR